jgi:hypothetical protein
MPGALARATEWNGKVLIMHKLRHPLTGACYEAVSQDVVRVEKDGREGTFTANGVWLSGEYRAPVDPEFCRWMASYVKQLEQSANLKWSGRDRKKLFQSYLAEQADRTSQPT